MNNVWVQSTQIIVQKNHQNTFMVQRTLIFVHKNH